jgi:hypothetical protein
MLIRTAAHNTRFGVSRAGRTSSQQWIKAKLYRLAERQKKQQEKRIHSFSIQGFDQADGMLIPAIAKPCSLAAIFLDRKS